MKDSTKCLIDGIFMDLIPRDADTVTDFGLEGNDRITVFGAYQWGYKREVFTDEELDQASCHGPSLTELVHREKDGQVNPYGHNLTITTRYDSLPPGWSGGDEAMEGGAQ